MKLSAKFIWNLKRIIPFGIIWFFLGVLFLLVEHLALGHQSNALDSAIKLQTDVVIFALLVITLIGLILGTIEVLWLKRLFEKKQFTTNIIGKFFIYILFFLLVIFITYPIAASLELETSIIDKRVWDKYAYFFFSITNLSAMIQLSFSLLISLFYAEISNNVGQNVLLNFFTGKYHKPIVEDRIFMFVDMKDSTPIAESLGHKKYFALLRSYYNDFSNAIIENYGEVYQYVGDEIVITWKLQKGIVNNRCIRCFFDMKSDLKKKDKRYKSTYGISPSFKAALHYGKVTTGEIGALKKDIFFTGDVLNTTARILGLCTIYKKDLLVSQNLVDKLLLKEEFDSLNIGNMELKGKKETVKVVAISNKPLK
ncbi:adenylate/guanylate cyclase domain-containing protein [Spongiivirga sp. MCCC 1A20706]|uniref:adenylate/guanylate cyclase domain-containing protein n=1 Tax=Spongiivirga sp. MCCC 1A20706 TaxID=3160963 RepID=UPI003977999D